MRDQGKGGRGGRRRQRRGLEEKVKEKKKVFRHSILEEENTVANLLILPLKSCHFHVLLEVVHIVVVSLNGL